MQAVWSVLNQKAACTHEEIDNDGGLSLIVRRRNKLRILSRVFEMSKAFNVIAWAHRISGQAPRRLAAWGTIALLYQQPKYFLKYLRRVRIELDRGGGDIGLYPKIALPAVMKFERSLRI